MQLLSFFVHFHVCNFLSSDDLISVKLQISCVMLMLAVHFCLIAFNLELQYCAQVFSHPSFLYVLQG